MSLVRPRFFLAWVVAFLPATIMHISFSALSWRKPSSLTDPLQVFVAAIVSPILETMALGGVLLLARILFSNVYSLAAVSGVLWAALHAAFSLLWGIEVLCSFIVYSYCFLYWSRTSRLKAFLFTTSLHMAYNIAAILLLNLTANFTQL
jgi:hypothetical protein